jgi:hypothetical protein
MAGGEDDEMTCMELVEVVTDYLEGTLPDPDRKRLEALGALPAEPIDPARHDELLRAFRGWRSTAP